jgi:tripartite-type tricarboxylate transporter receptor subunit TctC
MVAALGAREHFQFLFLRTVAALNAAILRALKSPDVLQRLQALGMNAAPSTPAEFDKQIRDDYALWGKVVKLSGAKAD